MSTQTLKLLKISKLKDYPLPMRTACPICNGVFSTDAELIAHQLLHDPSDRVVCRRCGHKSTTLNVHLIHASKCLQCALCGETFSASTDYEEHGCSVVCPCGNKFEKYDELVRHTNGPKPSFCCECHNSYDSVAGLVKHFLQHTRERFVCNYCQKEFPSRRSFKIHLRRKHLPEDGADMDELSGKIGGAPDYEGKNHRAKDKITPSLCPDCGKIFSTPLRLNQHMPLHYPDPVTCDTCKKVLKTKKILAEHLKTHMTTEGGTRVAQAICPHCGLELAQKGSLARHIILVHERHKLENRTEIPRVCKECGVTLPSAAKYYSHMRWHRAEKERYPCDYCGREFNKKHNLIRHIHLLHDSSRYTEKPYQCEVCYKPFKDKRQLVKHCLTEHAYSYDSGVVT